MTMCEGCVLDKILGGRQKMRVVSSEIGILTKRHVLDKIKYNKLAYVCYRACCQGYSLHALNIDLTWRKRVALMFLCSFQLVLNDNL
jgi:hypothetical protein